MTDHDPGSPPDDSAPESSGPEDPGAQDSGAQEPGTGESDADAVPTVYTDARDVAAIVELAEAERAAVRRGATPAQAAGLRAVGDARRTEDRIARWRSGGPGERSPR